MSSKCKVIPLPPKKVSKKERENGSGATPQNPKLIPSDCRRSRLVIKKLTAKTKSEANLRRRNSWSDFFQVACMPEQGSPVRAAGRRPWPGRARQPYSIMILHTWPSAEPERGGGSPVAVGSTLGPGRDWAGHLV